VGYTKAVATKQEGTSVGKIIVRARRLRFTKQAAENRKVTLQEVATAIGVEVATLNRIELGKTSAIDFAILSKLCAFYGVGVCEVMEYTEDDSAENAENSIEDLEEVLG
jgi:DNA-binding Xre family transcriptional regulator